MIHDDDYHDGYDIYIATLVQKQALDYDVICQRNARVCLSILNGSFPRLRFLSDH
jgi:hypothetical protein